MICNMLRKRLIVHELIIVNLQCQHLRWELEPPLLPVTKPRGAMEGSLPWNIYLNITLCSCFSDCLTVVPCPLEDLHFPQKAVMYIASSSWLSVNDHKPVVPLRSLPPSASYPSQCIPRSDGITLFTPLLHGALTAYTVFVYERTSTVPRPRAH